MSKKIYKNKETRSYDYIQVGKRKTKQTCDICNKETNDIFNIRNKNTKIKFLTTCYPCMHNLQMKLFDVVMDQRRKLIE